MLQNRVLKSRALLQAHSLDALLLTSLQNIRYLSGFTGSDGAFLLTPADEILLVDGRYTTQAREEAPQATVICYLNKASGIAEQFGRFSLARVGIESQCLSVAALQMLQNAAPDVTFVSLTTDVDELRQCKDSAEIELLAATASLAGSALQETLAQITVGMTEREIALSLEFAMKKKGAEAIAFDFIVASGERGALPHGRASNKKLTSGDLLTIDCGAVSAGYHSDETVTVAVGTCDSRQQELYHIVKTAHDLAISAIRPGILMKELDSIARDYIVSQGYGDYFCHGLGHGIGLEIHEKPTVNSRSAAPVCEGMVFTVEPGLYIPGWGGIRLEDTVLVTAESCRILTTVSKELQLVAL